LNGKDRVRGNFEDVASDEGWLAGLLPAILTSHVIDHDGSVAGVDSSPAGAAAAAAATTTTSRSIDE
jgi:hypothetical protein